MLRRIVKKTCPYSAALGGCERTSAERKLLRGYWAVVDKRSREEKIRISELAVVSLWSLWTGRKLGPVAMWLSTKDYKNTMITVKYKSSL